MMCSYLRYFALAVACTVYASAAGQALQGVRICIDPGHGGYNPANDRQIFLPHGLVYWESEGNFTTALHVRDYLEALGAVVRLTRTGNEESDDISLAARSAIANAMGADYFHSIHTNAGGGNYSLVLYKEVNGQPAFEEAREMGQIMAPRLERLMRTERWLNKGDRSFLGFNLGVLRNTDMPATLSEGSFHDVPEEGLRLRNSAYLQNYAWAIVQAFCSYFEANCFTTARIGGIVRDAATNDPVNDVYVHVTPGNYEYFGDDGYNGFYALDALMPGTYTVTVERAGYIRRQFQITVQANTYYERDVRLAPSADGRPFADFHIEGLPAGAGDTLTFDASPSQDDGSIVRYLWDFGDGTNDMGVRVRHVYAHDSTYVVSLTVWDDDNNSSTLSKRIEIRTPIPAVPTLRYVLHLPEDTAIALYGIPSYDVRGTGYAFSLHPIDTALESLLFIGPWDSLLARGRLTVQLSDSAAPKSRIPYRVEFYALNRMGARSPSSDVYGLYFQTLPDATRLLIVDGFDRQASYPHLTHDFGWRYLQGLWHVADTLDIQCTANEAVASGKVQLTNYDIVWWFLGDESTRDETFSAKEQAAIRQYLEAGGKLFVTGSEIAWDLDKKGSATDRNFFRNYLKARFVDDGNASLTPARGVRRTLWEGLTLHFGKVYPEDYPDVLQPEEGAFPILRYRNGGIAGIAYRGTFGNGTSQGALVYIGFPLETVADTSTFRQFVQKVLEFFQQPSTGTQTPTGSKQIIHIAPNPFRNHLYIKNLSPRAIRVSIVGTNTRFLWTQTLHPHQRYTIDTHRWPIGAYILTRRSDGQVQPITIIKLP